MRSHVCLDFEFSNFHPPASHLHPFPPGTSTPFPLTSAYLSTVTTNHNDDEKGWDSKRDLGQDSRCEAYVSQSSTTTRRDRIWDVTCTRLKVQRQWEGTGFEMWDVHILWYVFFFIPFYCLKAQRRREGTGFETWDVCILWYVFFFHSFLLSQDSTTTRRDRIWDVMCTRLKVQRQWEGTGFEMWDVRISILVVCFFFIPFYWDSFTVTNAATTTTAASRRDGIWDMTHTSNHNNNNKKGQDSRMDRIRDVRHASQGIFSFLFTLLKFFYSH